MATESTHIGIYRIERELGRGGMGVVHLAYDTRLDRHVAIKEMPESLAHDPERLGRFEREAKTLAQLNHPNVTSIHGIEEHDGRQFLVLEYVEGETLAQMLARGPIPTDEALAIAVQVAAGVAAAHDAGVIHRDLKPGNVIVTPDGRATVLDFGLARATAPDTLSSDAHASTIASPAMNSPTVAGMILGTAAYMSPEQARGRPVDRRTDVWSFGVVLYEMLTGARAFDGETVSDCIAAVLQREVDFAALPKDVPGGVRRILEQCLTRDRDVRRRDVGDVGSELERIRRGENETTGSAGTPNRLPWVVAVIASLACIALVVANGLPSPTGDDAPLPIVAAINTPPGTELSLSLSNPSVPSISPDGRWLVYGARSHRRGYELNLLDLATGRNRVLEGTERGQYPFWSPDAKSIGFFASERGLLRVEREGGPPRLLFEGAQNGKGGLWLADGRIVFAPSPQDGLSVIDADGGEVRAITDLDGERGELSHRHPRRLPGDESIVYFVRDEDAIAGTEPGEIRARRLDGSTDRLLVESFGNGVYDDGHLLYAVDATLVARPFDVDTLEFTGEARTIVDDVLVLQGASLAVFDVSPSGALTYVSRDVRSQKERIVRYDRAGRRLETVLDDVDMVSFESIGDGSRITANVYARERGELQRVVIDLESGESRRLEEAIPSSDLVSVSPDGRRYAHVRLTDEDDVILVGRVDAYVDDLEIARVSDTRRTPFVDSWSADGRWIYARIVPFGEYARDSIWRAYRSDGSGEYEDLEFPAQTSSVRSSPDGRFLAFVVEIRNEDHVMVAPADLSSDAVRLTSHPASGLRWRADGGELFVHHTDGVVAAIDTRADSPVDFGEPRELFDSGSFSVSNWNPVLDVAPDGQSFLLLEPTADDDFGTFTVMTDWRASIEE